MTMYATLEEAIDAAREEFLADVITFTVISTYFSLRLYQSVLSKSPGSF